ncbi:glucose/galactose MFS transporter [Saccharicrinis fermentans]|uniref:L-fucose permease n=1 Tax=Saccharicrinis fermentans DSM 9555 = JCM 21142 TaxID=869213 RepID=W7YG89_9BACT|nr:glucose/galactose MFS transporter [Saccharicrinis fermentans]GAF03461.1 L-fucose permease [Saccharicrinis fermentans DSM 9555 = JCM 21142]
MGSSKTNYTVPFIIMSFLLFLLGFVTWMNGILVPFLQKLYDLKPAVAQLVNAAFFSAYIISIPVGGVVKKLGYKKSVIIGALITGIGSLLFIPAVTTGFGMFLFALFVSAIGIVVLQVAANPYVIALGSPETSSARLTLAMAVNSAAAVLAPFVGTALIMSKVSGDPVADALLARPPYYVLGGIAVLTAVLLIFMKLPAISDDDAQEGGGEERSAWSYTHLVLGFVAIGMYMGLEVGVNSFLYRYMETKIGLSAEDIKFWMMAYPFGFVIGRLAGAAILKKNSPNKVLAISSALGALMILITVSTEGYVALGSILATGLFHSIMWSVIFDLSLKDVVPSAAKLGSGILCTGVVFVGLWTYVMGSIEAISNISTAYMVLWVFYAFIIYFALAGSKIRKKVA